MKCHRCFGFGWRWFVVVVVVVVVGSGWGVVVLPCSCPLRPYQHLSPVVLLLLFVVVMRLG